MNSIHKLQAVFTQTTKTLVINVTGSGSTSPTVGSHSYILGSGVPVTANPTLGWSFDHWVLDGSLVGSTNPFTVTINSEHTLTANFTQNQYTISTNTSGQGTISINPNQSSYNYGTTVQLTATSVAGWAFTGWGGDASGSSNPLQATVTKNMLITAIFTANGFTLTTTTNPVNSGTVLKSPDQQSYTSGSTVQLTANPQLGWTFSSWGGDLSSSTNPVTISLDSSKVVTASFIQNQYTITVTTSGQGSVSMSPSQTTYTYGSSVQLTAIPATGWTFSGWSGDALSTSNPVSLRVTGEIALVATFTQNTNIPDSNYSIKNIGSSYSSYNQVGTVIASSTDFGYLLNNLNGILVPGDVISIFSGTYMVKTMPLISSSHVTIQGVGNPTLIISSSLTHYGFDLSGSYNTVENITINANYNGVISPVFMVNGQYNTVQYCTFKNAIQYCLEVFGSDHFTFSHNVFNKAQYGIATGGGNGYPFSTNGEISYNVFKDCQQVGIKLRWCQNTIVHDNSIDIAWVTWLNQTVQTDQQPTGIRFYQADGPTNSVTVENNNIVNSGPATWTVAGMTYRSVGILIDTDAPVNWGGYTGSSSGQIVLNNSVAGVYVGIRNCFVPGTTPSISGTIFTNVVNKMWIG